MAPDSAPPRFACEPFGRHFDLSGSCPLSYDVADIGTFTAPAVLVFAKRFKDLVGVAVDRISRALDAAGGQTPEQGVRIAETASSVGYRSEATFSRVFKRFAGASDRRMAPARPKVDQSS